MELGWFLVVSTVFLSSFLAECALDFQCLKCLCETATQCASKSCDPEKCSKIEVNNYDCACGPFGITPPFWISSNKPVLDDKPGTELEKFKRCVETLPCSIWAVQYYMEKYADDCDNDKLINCDDYVLIHTFGPNNCHNISLDEERLKRYKSCMSRTEIIHSGGSDKTVSTTSTTTLGTTSNNSNKTEVSTISAIQEQNYPSEENSELNEDFDVFT